MTDSLTPIIRALVVATLLLATATLMVVAVNTARAGGAVTAAIADRHPAPMAVSFLAK